MSFEYDKEGKPNCVANWKILEQLLARMNWKDQRKMILSLPPVCISSEVSSVDSLSGGIIVPVSGKLTRLVVRTILEDKPPGLIKMTIEGTSSSTDQIFEINGNVFVKELSMDIDTGSVIKLSPIGTGVIKAIGFSALISPKESILRHVPNAFPAMEDANA